MKKKTDYTIESVLLVLMLAILGSMVGSCKKEKGTPIPEANRQQAESFKTFIKSHDFRLVSYTSETPIDYEPTDTVGAKTNHWEYVSYHLKDDEINFSGDGTIVIYQHDNWIAGSDTDTLMRTWDVAADRDGVSFRFLNFVYEPLDYRLVQFNDTSFVVRATWNNSEVISTFKAL